MEENQIFWLNYLFFADFSDDKDSLVDLAVGTVDQHTATLLAAALSTHDQGEGRALWVDTNNPAWGLLGAEIVYNGPNMTGMPTNGMFDHVLTLKFPDAQTSPQGVLSLNYNMGTGTAPAVPAPDTTTTSS